MRHMGYTATDASKEIGCSIATVSRWARTLGLGNKYGSSYVFTPAEIKKISREWKKTKGRPKESDKKDR